MELPKEIIDRIQDEIIPSIDKKTLSDNLLHLVYEQHWFNLWVPKEYGGLGYGLEEGCKLLEELAYVDGGFGWTVTLCSGANMFAGFLDPDLATTLFQKPNVCWGGSGKPSGKAERVEDGYLITGYWQYATGAPHLTHFTLNAWVYENGSPAVDEKGEPIYQSFFVDRDDVLVHYDWDTFGLACTASHSFSVQQLFVPANRAFTIAPAARTHASKLFEIPFMPFAACTLAVNYIGMFRRFLDLLERQLMVKAQDPGRDGPQLKRILRALDQARLAIEERSARLYALMALVWKNDAVDASLVDEIDTVSRDCVALGKAAIVELFPYGGIAAAQWDNALNIVFRHFFTATQHNLLQR
ncbi:acyl-CoA dehydrogenase family protein [Sphingobacterium paludis]|uniref:Alkylation response protein AidB-like acyl-CoA dehydrogenase n=1 Tax=Sphingobacterium paludis TaxID=1476465 RepID=A0A4R7D9M3_9SPHI|nr:acyl-CoA dehydrogenase family protein [Sphingobacterium paludis]TDS17740.1 alkylation response protein AidB-like acyl-CoA dehydrogenase [Sphingobacterium paludis]